MLVDDHELFAESLAIALEEYSEISSFYTVRNIDSLARLTEEKGIDIVLMDINLGKMSGGDGLSAARRLRREAPGVKIIILTGYDLPVYRYEARKLGMSGFLNKNISPEGLLRALRAVYQGKTCFPSSDSSCMIEELTDMEKTILQMLAGGEKRKEIAGKLYISERTLSNHLQHIYEKLEVSSSIEAVTKALRMGYISM